jgi:threonine/homoserine efflux transporter RhtA
MIRSWTLRPTGYRRLNVPPPLLFVAGGCSMYLGAALAVVLFNQVSPAGVAWLRMLVAALVLLAWRRPDRAAWVGNRLGVAACFGIVTGLAARRADVGDVHRARKAGCPRRKRSRRHDGRVHLRRGAVVPAGAGQGTAWGSPILLVMTAGVGVLSTVLPYALDQVVLRRIDRARFALLLALLPAVASVVGLVVLGQLPHPMEAVGITAIALAVAAAR